MKLGYTCAGASRGGSKYTRGGYTYSQRPRLQTRRQSGGCAGGTVGFGTSFNNVPISTFYPLNSFQTDPNYYSLDTRNIPMSGGKSRRRRLGRRKTVSRRSRISK